MPFRHSLQNSTFCQPHTIVKCGRLCKTGNTLFISKNRLSGVSYVEMHRAFFTAAELSAQLRLALKNYTVLLLQYIGP